MINKYLTIFRHELVELGKTVLRHNLQRFDKRSGLIGMLK